MNRSVTPAEACAELVATAGTEVKLEVLAACIQGGSHPPSAVFKVKEGIAAREAYRVGLWTYRNGTLSMDHRTAQAIVEQLEAEGRLLGLSQRMVAAFESSGAAIDRGRYGDIRVPRSRVWARQATEAELEGQFRAPKEGEPLEIDELLPYLFYDPDLRCIQRSAPSVVARVLPTYLHEALMELHPLRPLRVKAEWLVSERPAWEAGQLVLATLDALEGRLAPARARAAVVGESALGLDAVLSMMSGELDAAVKQMTQAATVDRRRRGTGDDILGLPGWFTHFIFLASGAEARIKAAETSLRRLERQPSARGQLIVPHLDRLAQLQRGRAPAVAAPAAGGYAALIEGLVACWAGEEVDTDRYRAYADAARSAGHLWLAGELASLMSVASPAALQGPSPSPEGYVPLRRLREPIIAWEKVLDALEAVVGPRKSAAAPAGPRVCWLLAEAAGELTLEALVQVANRSGYSKGKKVAVSRIIAGPASIPEMTDQDRVVAAGLTVQLDTQYYQRYIYRWPYHETLSALVGHPALYRLDSPDEAIEVVATEPVLQVKEVAGKLLLSVLPRPPAGDRRVVATRVSDTRYEVARFSVAQVAMAKLIGDGLSLPRDAASRLSAALATVGATFPVLDQARVMEGGGNVVELEGDPRPLLQLSPKGAGLLIRVQSAPLGADGPRLSVGLGARQVMGRRDGAPYLARRDLPAEVAALDELIALIPALSSLCLGEVAEVETVEEALEVIEGLHGLGESVHVEWPEGVALRLRPSPPSRSLRLTVKASGAWFEAAGALKVDDELSLQMGELLDLVSVGSSRFVRLADGEFLALSDRLRRRLSAVARVAQRAGAKVRVHPMAAGLLGELLEGSASSGDKAWNELQARLHAPPPPPPLPTNLQAELRPYQVVGFEWMARLASLGLGGILADDMGLGKTVQALALLLHRGALGPALIVAPTSVTAGWATEARRFAPALRIHRFGEVDRQTQLRQLGPMDVVVTSYGLLVSEAERLAALRFATLITDEAQALKNPETQRHKAVAALQADQRYALTGTPVENHVGELWAQLELLNPGALGSWGHFKARFADPVTNGDKEARDALRRLILPYVLRRTKAAVLDDLPPRTEVQLDVELSPAERSLYEALRQRALEDLSGAGQKATPLQVLAWLTRLRLACCHPRLAVAEAAKLEGSKLHAFQRLVVDLRLNKHRALVFSQFVKHLDVLREWLDKEQISYQYLDGSTPAKERAARVDAFQAGQGDLFLISLKAGGTGLNLTAADYVVHMDPWWNPAVEDQASDRAHRIGQARPVTVYRLVTKGTIEEQILALHKDKRDLADQLLDGTGGSAALSTSELIEVLRGG